MKLIKTILLMAVVAAITWFVAPRIEVDRYVEVDYTKTPEVIQAENRHVFLTALAVCESGDIELGTYNPKAINENEPNGWNSRGAWQWQYPSMKDKFAEWGIDYNLSRDKYKLLAEEEKEAYWITERTIFEDGELTRWSDRCINHAIKAL